MAGGFDTSGWAKANEGFVAMSAAEAAEVIEHWRGTAQAATGARAELAGPFQRHLTARGTGVPSNFCLVLTAAEAIAFKFDPARTEHPLLVGPDQFGDEQARWPLGSVRVAAVEPGRMAWGVRFEVDGGKPIPCRTPRLPRNPAAAAVVTQLGGTLPPA